MASKSYFARPNYPVNIIESNSMYELDESDVWNVSVCPESCKKLPCDTRMTKGRSSMAVKRGTPMVSVPEWSKMAKEANSKRYGDGDECDKPIEDWIPPHEYLATRRIASFSVQEGVGRTLKGRDLRRVRNAIWEITGFQD